MYPESFSRSPACEVNLVNAFDANLVLIRGLANFACKYHIYIDSNGSRNIWD